MIYFIDSLIFYLIFFNFIMSIAPIEMVLLCNRSDDVFHIWQIGCVPPGYSFGCYTFATTTTYHRYAFINVPIFEKRVDFRRECSVLLMLSYWMAGFFFFIQYTHTLLCHHTLMRFCIMHKNSEAMFSYDHKFDSIDFMDQKMLKCH